MGDSRLTTTFGILLSGLLSAEAQTQRSVPRRRSRPLRARSGTYPNAGRSAPPEPATRGPSEAPSAAR